ncbi:hypothetical protein SUGI_0588480 [Cryptomeria japonica]|nr:hypothetical protein SUGI_0588480 [Cryptomeria japonica]
MIGRCRGFTFHHSRERTTIQGLKKQTGMLELSFLGFRLHVINLGGQVNELINPFFLQLLLQLNLSH